MRGGGRREAWGRAPTAVSGRILSGRAPYAGRVARTITEAMAEGPVVLDGGLATQLEVQGRDLVLDPVGLVEPLRGQIT